MFKEAVIAINSFQMLVSWQMIPLWGLRVLAASLETVIVCIGRVFQHFHPSSYILDTCYFECLLMQQPHDNDVTNEAIEICWLWSPMYLFPSECLEVNEANGHTWSSLSTRCCSEQSFGALWELGLAIADTTDPMAFENLGQSGASSQVSLLSGWDCKQEVPWLGARSRKGVLLGQKRGKRLCSW